MPQQVSTVLLRGGLNLVTPAIAMPPGSCIAAENYEPDVRGYRRIGGIERYDGRPRPSSASYWVLNFTGGSVAMTAGQLVTGATSTNTATVLVDAVVTSGSYGSSNAAGYVVVYNASGVFANGENLQVSAVTVAVANRTAIARGADTDANDTAWYRAAVAATRTPISAPPGSGPIRGVWAYNGSAYCFRDNAGATAGVMYKATSAGWIAQTLGETVDFTAGTAAYKEGETLTKGAVTSTIRRVVVTSGVWGSTAAGYLVISARSGGSYSAGTATSASGSATLSGAETAITLPPGGSYRFTNHNFYGAAYSVRMYGVNGVGQAFMWDGTYFTPIRTGLSNALDKPTHIAQFANHLFLGYVSGTINFSSIGEPLTYITTTGSGTFSFGSQVTDMLESASTSMIIFGRGRVSYVTGSSAATFILNSISTDAGAVYGTAQMVGGDPIYQDEAGIRRMSTTLAFGAWTMNTISQLITPVFKAKQDAGVTSVGSIRSRARDQYKLFFSDGTGVTVYLGRSVPEIIPFNLGSVIVSCSCAGPIDGATGQEVMLIGSTTGMVYQLDVGQSFDGNQISAFMLLPFNFVGTTAQVKRFYKAALEIDAGPSTSIAMSAEFDYGNSNQPAASEQSFNVSGGGGLWNQMLWNNFYWSASYQGLAEAYIQGRGRNAAIGVMSDATYEDPHTLSALTLNYVNLGVVR